MDRRKEVIAVNRIAYQTLIWMLVMRSLDIFVKANRALYVAQTVCERFTQAHMQREQQFNKNRFHYIKTRIQFQNRR